MPFCVKIKTLNQATIPEIPVYKPTVAEFEDFSKCISMIESLGAHHVGLCKVIPPSNWVGRRKGYDNIDECLVEKPICQSTYGGRGIYFQVCFTNFLNNQCRIFHPEKVSNSVTLKILLYQVYIAPLSTGITITLKENTGRR